jgi:DnaK suppressor protein
MGTAQELQQQNLLTVNIKNKELQETLYALNLIESDEYGYCQQSGSEIGIKRLLANPTATLTVEAKSRQEFMLRTRGIA